MCNLCILTVTLHFVEISIHKISIFILFFFVKLIFIYSVLGNKSKTDKLQFYQTMSDGDTNEDLLNSSI